MARERSSRRSTSSEPQWLTLGEAARYLGVAQSTIRKWSDSGRVRAFYTPGRHRRYQRDDLDAFLESSGPAAGEGPLVLIVDDDAQVREYVRINLEAEGYNVREAGNAEEGLLAVEESQPDLVLLDVMMPQVDGWQTLQQLQERHGEAVPVVMFSGKADAATADEVAERGARGFIGKPFDPGQLIEKTKQLLSS